MTSRLLSLLAALIATAIGSAVHAEKMGPGTYHGYYAETRWGSKVLHLGPYHVFVSDAAAAVLKRHGNSPMAVQVESLALAPLGNGMIDKVGKINKTAFATPLELSARLAESRVARGQGITVTLSLRNQSKKRIAIGPKDLAMVFATNSTAGEDEINHHHPEDRAYWYYRYGYHPFGQSGREEKSRQIACHEILLGSLGPPLAGKGKGFRVDDQSGLKGGIAIEPGGWYEVSFLVGRELPADDYEVFFYLTSGNLSSTPGPTSKRLPFDVLETK